uniref:Ubiquitin-like domain-containing protein n=1 Tax=Oryza meridionalis TaxID=40149 RepID=A0A0E0D0Y7_9ORYZ
MKIFQTHGPVHMAHRRRQQSAARPRTAPRSTSGSPIHPVSSPAAGADLHPASRGGAGVLLLPPPHHRSPAMYIRVKRNKTTYFIQCDPTETTLSIKQKLHSLVDQPPGNQQLILLATTEVVLDDSKTLADQKVENDAVVALTLRKDDNVFEEVSIARPEDFMSSS